MKDDIFNNYNLTDGEVSKILMDFKNVIKAKTSNLGGYKEDCEQEIKMQIYKILIKNRRNKKI